MKDGSINRSLGPRYARARRKARAALSVSRSLWVTICAFCQSQHASSRDGLQEYQLL